MIGSIEDATTLSMVKEEIEACKKAGTKFDGLGEKMALQIVIKPRFTNRLKKVIPERNLKIKQLLIFIF